MQQNRRTLLKTVGALGAASLVTAGASARSTLDSSFDLDGGPQEALVVFENRSRIDALDALDAPYHAFEVLPIAYARLDGDQLEAVAALDVVRRVAPNSELEYHNGDAREVTGVAAVRDDLEYTGDGVHAVVVDSGVDGSHPDLAENLQHNYRYVDPIYSGTMWVDAGPANTDDNGHGTHTSGSVGGTGAESDGEYAGMAPDVDLTVYSTGLSLAIVQAVGAFDHMLANHADAQVVSNSYGTASGADFDPNDPLNVATWAAFQADILPVFSAGNSGESCATPAGVVNCETAYNSLNNYVKAPYVLGVAATDDDRVVTDFSSRGRREGDGGPEGAHYDRDAALDNYRTWLEADGSPTETAPYGTFEASGTSGGAVGVGLVQTTDTFSLPAGDLGDYDGYRVDATVTWEPSNPDGTEPNSFEVALETAEGDEVASSDDDGFTTGEDNETRLVVENLAPGDYQFAVTGWRGAGNWELSADLERATYGDASADGPLGIYRPGVGAPGSGVISTMNPAHPLQAAGDDTEVYYGALSGTSMSCPVTAGIAALVYEAHEDAHGEYPSPEAVIEFIEDSAERSLDSHTVVNVGEGFVDAVGAVERARAGETLAAPELDPIPDQRERAGDVVAFEATATPADVSLSASNLPDGATFADRGDGTGEFRWETEPRDAGRSPYVVTVTASNAAGADSRDVEIELEPPRGNPNGNASGS